MNETSERDPLLSDAYDRLAGATHAPADGPARVQRRIAVRRRRRRVATGLAVAVAVGGTTLAAVTTGGEPDRAVDAASEPPPSPLTTTLADGSTYAFEGIEVTCEDGLLVAQNEQQLTGSGDEARLAEPFIYLEVRPDQVTPGESLTLPVDGPGSSDTYPVLLFFALEDRPGGPPERRANELSSASMGSSGTVRVDEATCGPEPRLALTVDAVLGSELENRAAMPLRGELR
ncbi:hypothetical protein [Nocardioides abyssi]|uniref:SipW-cognate class signal peptide n=1 Tax=Nocardioides abyssi TaxID=3058370 RepID=A0ABT8EU03_9ACTN|nr:hypothetical protein [Nocardioides abyssi]MDN4161441.1 hypothetical protein [Nocardioides abyssi]